MTSLFFSSTLLFSPYAFSNVYATTMNSEISASVDSDLKYATVIYTASDIFLLPSKIWHREGEYGGYLTKTYIEMRQDGIWYGTYTGYLRKGAFEAKQILDSK